MQDIIKQVNTERQQYKLNDKKLKSSYYNHFVNLDSEHFLLFNANTSALVKIGLHHLSRIQQLLNFPENIDEEDSLVKSLLRGGFLLNADEDEKSNISQRLMRSRYSKEFCSVTISPTMGCNFNCSYCFESEEVRAKYDRMDDVTQEKLISFLSEHFKLYGTKNLEICWFGGEPLLALSAIENISHKLIKISDELGISYSAHIITNGYRLNKEAATILKNSRVNSAQITLDGPEKIHDNRRYLKGGKGSYKKIIKNIKESCDIIDLIIRINVDKQNYKYLQEFLKEIDADGVTKKVNIELAYVHTNDSVSDNSPSVSRKFFSDIDLEFTKMTLENEYNHFHRPSVVTNACGGDHAYSYMVGPKGELYQCWEDFGNPEFVVGSIFSEKRENAAYVQKYFDFDATKDPKCMNCTVLPLCMGGCPKHRLMHDGVPQCGVYKFNLNEYILGLVKQNSEKQLRTKDDHSQEKIFLYDRFFHQPEPNNFVYLLIPLRFNKDKILNDISNQTAALNIADESLLNLFESLLDGADFADISHWKKAILDKKNLLGINYAISTINYVQKKVIHQPIKEFLISRRNDIIEKFTQIPDSLSCINRLNFYVKREYLKDVIQKLIYLFGENPELFKIIARLEIAKGEIKTNKVANYPTLIIYLEPDIINSPDFSKLLKKIAGFVMINVAMFNNVNNEFAYEWLPYVTVTQGFRLYKQYLNALNLIEDIYDKDHNFAFTKLQAEKWVNCLK